MKQGRPFESRSLLTSKNSSLAHTVALAGRIGSIGSFVHHQEIHNGALTCIWLFYLGGHIGAILLHVDAFVTEQRGFHLSSGRKTPVTEQ